MPDVVAIDRELDITMPKKGAVVKNKADGYGKIATAANKSAASTAASLDGAMKADSTFNDAAASSANSSFNVEGSHCAAPASQQQVSAAIVPANASSVVGMRAFIRKAGSRALVAIGLYALHKNYRKVFNDLFRGKDQLSTVATCFALFFGLRYLQD